MISFCRKQFLKILIDYYVVLIPVMALLFFFQRESISLTLVLKCLCTFGTVNGGGHLWYIRYILFCYLLTPLYLKLMDYLFARKDSIIFWGRLSENSDAHIMKKW